MKNYQLDNLSKDKMVDQNQQPLHKKQENLLQIRKDHLIRKSSIDISEVYFIHKKLGQGSYGEVFLVTHKILKVKRALKIVHKTEKPHSNAADQLEILKRLDHPNILKIFEFFQTKDKWYIVTDYFEGTELFEEIVVNNRLSESLTAQIVQEIVKALNYIHTNNIAHRDVKAQNILVFKNCDKYVIKVIDWGLGALTNGDYMNRKCGTPQYCAPEVLTGKYTLACDMWSLGVLVYIMLSGCMPFKGKDVKETLIKVKQGFVDFTLPVWSDISMEAKVFVSQLLQKNPKLRLKASDCLTHKWIQKHCEQKQVENDKQKTLQQTLKRIKDFHTQTKFQVVVINYILNFIEGPKHLDKLKKQFDLLDLNGDGEISYEELLIAYRKIYGFQADLVVDEIFSSIDFDQSGKITFSEFITVASQIKQNFSAEQLQEAFKLFDADNDGLIDKRQISQLLQYQRSARSSKELEDIVSEIDLNNDGKIDLNEFVQHINRAVERVRTKSTTNMSVHKKSASKIKQPQKSIQNESKQSVENQQKQLIKERKSLIKLEDRQQQQ